MDRAPAETDTIRNEALDVAYLALAAAGGVPLSRFLWVDQNRADPQGNGSIGHPYATIQDALNFIGPGLVLADLDDSWAIGVVFSAAIPPENLQIPSRRRIVISSLAGTSDAPGVSTVKWTDNDTIPGAIAALTVLSGFTVTGFVLVDGSGPVSILVYDGARSPGPTDTTAHTGTSYITGSGFDAGQIDMPVGLFPPRGELRDCQNAHLTGNVTATLVEALELCQCGNVGFNASWVVTANSRLGWIDSVFDAPALGNFFFTGPVGSAVMDRVSEYSFDQGGKGVLLGAATKTIVETGGGRFAHGSYMGDGAVGGQVIPCPFSPSQVQIVDRILGPIAGDTIATLDMGGDAYTSFGPLTLLLPGLVTLGLPGAFKVDGNANTAGETYYWTANA